MHGKADLDGVRPERLHRPALNAFLEPFEAARIRRELMKCDIRAVIAVELLGGEALDGSDGACRGQDRDAVLRHLLVQQVGQRHKRLVAGGADRRRAPADVSAQAAEFVNPIRIAAAKVVRARWSMAFPRFYAEKATEKFRTIRQLRGVGKWKNAAPPASGSLASLSRLGAVRFAGPGFGGPNLRRQPSSPRP